MADKAARLEAELVIHRWNRRLATGRDMLWSPTIRAALVAGTPWLDVFCPGCGTSRAIDLRTVDRHPLASVDTLVLGLRLLMVSGLGADAQTARGSTPWRRQHGSRLPYKDAQRDVTPMRDRSFGSSLAPAPPRCC
jgi:hypothetical protein